MTEMTDCVGTRRVKKLMRIVTAVTFALFNIWKADC
jgi:hypothetical protein